MGSDDVPRGRYGVAPPGPNLVSRSDRLRLVIGPTQHLYLSQVSAKGPWYSFGIAEWNAKNSVPTIYQG